MSLFFWNCIFNFKPRHTIYLGSSMLLIFFYFLYFFHFYDHWASIFHLVVTEDCSMCLMFSSHFLNPWNVFARSFIYIPVMFTRDSACISTFHPSRQQWPTKVGRDGKHQNCMKDWEIHWICGPTRCCLYLRVVVFFCSVF